MKESQRKIVILLRQTELMMTPEKLKAIMSQGEGTEVELKESKDSLAQFVKRGNHTLGRVACC